MCIRDSDRPSGSFDPLYDVGQLELFHGDREVPRRTYAVGQHHSPCLLYTSGSRLVLQTRRVGRRGTEYYTAVGNQLFDLFQQLGPHRFELGQYQNPVLRAVRQCQQSIHDLHIALDHFGIDKVVLITCRNHGVEHPGHFRRIFADEIEMCIRDRPYRNNRSENDRGGNRSYHKDSRDGEHSFRKDAYRKDNAPRRDSRDSRDGERPFRKDDRRGSYSDRRSGYGDRREGGQRAYGNHKGFKKYDSTNYPRFEAPKQSGAVRLNRFIANSDVYKRQCNRR